MGMLAGGVELYGLGAFVLGGVEGFGLRVTVMLQLSRYARESERQASQRLTRKRRFRFGQYKRAFAFLVFP